MLFFLIRYILLPIYEAFAWFGRIVISPICNLFYKFLLKPILYVFRTLFGFFTKILSGLYYFFAEIAASIFLSPSEYEQREKEKIRKKEREQMEKEAKEKRDQRKMKSSQGQQLPSSFVSAPPMLYPSSPYNRNTNFNKNPTPELNPNNDSNNNNFNSYVENSNTQLQLQKRADCFWICPNCGEKVGLLFIDHHERICKNRA